MRGHAPRVARVRRTESRRADGAGVSFACQILSQAEIGDLRRAVRRQQHICRLEGATRPCVRRARRYFLRLLGVSGTRQSVLISDLLI